jgi:hypothetical protein
LAQVRALRAPRQNQESYHPQDRGPNTLFFEGSDGKPQGKDGVKRNQGEKKIEHFSPLSPPSYAS